MKPNYIVVDPQKWKRNQHCEVFRNSIEPAYCISVELNVGNFLSEIKKKNQSFTMGMIYMIAQCANEIEEFRYRFLEGQVVIYDKINTVFTYMDHDSELFKVVKVEMKEEIEEYILAAKIQAENQEEYFSAPPGNDVFMFSPLPWLAYTHISHTNSGKKENAVPIFSWGKYLNKDEIYTMPFSVQVHHSFVDGFHVGKLIDLLQKRLNEFAVKE